MSVKKTDTSFLREMHVHTVHQSTRQGRWQSRTQVQTERNYSTCTQLYSKQVEYIHDNKYNTLTWAASRTSSIQKEYQS